MTPSLHSRRSVLAAGTLLGTAALAGCAGFGGATSTGSMNATVSLRGAQRLVVENRNGDVVVEPDPDLTDHAVVNATLRVVGDTGLFDDVSVETAVDDETLTVETVYATVRARRVAVTLVVRVPAEFAVRRATTANGDVEVSDLPGDATVESANGDVLATRVDGFVTVRSANGDATARDCSGIVGASTANGNVEVDVRAIRGDVSLTSGNGDVAAALASDLDATLVCSTANGDVDVDVEDLAVTVTRDEPRRFEGTLGDGGDTITASSGNGDVELYALD
jgi:hypothetical protein